MANKLFKEPFKGKYDGVTSALHLPVGGISDGLNMRKISPIGGWKARKGCTLHNTTAVDSTHSVKSLHQYTHPISDDYHFIAQCNSLLYDSTNDPPTAGTTFGTSLGVTVGTTPGFSCQVGDWWVYADGSGTPIIYGGTTPRPLGFFTFSTDRDYRLRSETHNVTDGSTSTVGTLDDSADMIFIVVTSEPISAITLTIVTGNTNAVTINEADAMRSGTWTDLTSDASWSDGTLDTATSTKTLNQTGTITWDASSSDTLYQIDRVMGYCYKFSCSGALSNNVTISNITVTQAAHSITNKWNGAFETVTGCMFFDTSAANNQFKEALGYVSNESTSMYIDIGAGTTGDYLLLGCPEPATGFLLGIVKDYGNTNNAQVDGISYYNADDWSSEITTGIVDSTTNSTAGFSQTGVIFFDGASTTPKQYAIFDLTQMYYYRLHWDATLSADCRIYYAGYIPMPLALGTYDGCVEFKGRLILWGDQQYPNRLRYSALDRPDVFSGIDSGYTQAFGAGDDIKCALNFYNELLIWKANSVWMLEGFDRVTFGSLRITKTVGLASPKTAKVVEVGTPGMSALEPRSIAIWQDTDGVYVLDGSKPRKVSMPIDHLFNPEYSTCIAATNINDLQAFVDPIRNEYHLLLPANIDYYGDQSLYVNELVYNYATDEWYPPWYRNIALVCGINFKGTDNRDYIYGASSSGFIMRLENDTTDKSTANADVAIQQRLKTRAIAATQEQSSTLWIDVRHIWPEFKARLAGTPTVNIYPDLATSATSLGTASMVNSGYSLANPAVPSSQQCQGCFQIELVLNTVDQEMEIYGITYELSGRGLSNL